MNRSTTAVLLVGLLIIQGSVAGVLGGVGVSSATEGDTAGGVTDSEHTASDDSTAASTNATSGESATSIETSTGASEGGSTENATTAGTASAFEASPQTTRSSQGGGESSPSATESSPTASASDGDPSSATSSETAREFRSRSSGADATSGTPSGAAGATSTGTGSETPSGTSSSGPSPSGATSAGADRSSARAGASSATGATGTQAASPDAEFEITSVSSDVPVGETGTVSITIENTGEDATDAVIDLRSLSSDLTFGQSATTSRFIGEWDEGESRTIEVTMRAVPTADTTEYPVRATVSYVDDDGNQAQSAPLTFGVEPDERQDRFAVVSSSSTVQVGTEGEVAVTLENTGEDVTDAVVNLQSLSGDIRFGRAPNATRYVGEWPASAERTVTFTATASNQTETRSYPLRASVSYEDDGDSERAGPFTVGITPQPEQEFSLSDTDSTLAVGDEGRITGTITNEGPQDAQNAVVTLVSESQNIQPQETRYAIGSLSEGESANVSFPVTVTGSAEPGQQQFSFVVRYDNEGDTRRSQALDTQLPIAPQSDEFIVETRNASVEAGSSDTMTLVMTNNRDRSVRNVNAKAFVDSPLSISSDEAYIAQLNPGESEEISFEVSTSSGASEGQYPFSVDFQYETASGESELSQTYEVPVEVTASDGSGFLSSRSLIGGFGLLLMLSAVGWVWWRR